MNKAKKYVLFFIILWICPFIVNAENANEIKIDNYVVDKANILSEDTKNYIIEKGKTLENADGTQFIVLTVNSLGGSSVEDFALTVGRNNKLGRKNINNGLILLIALEERELRIEVGDGLEGILPDGKCGRFRDTYIIPYLKNNEWDKGIKNGYDAFYKEIVTSNNLSIDYSNPTGTSNQELVLFFALCSLFIGIVLGNVLKNNNKKKISAIVPYYIIIISFLLLLGFSLKISFLVINPLANIFGIMIGLGSGFSSSSRGYSGRGGGSFGGGGGFSGGGGGGFSGGGASGKF